MKHVGIENKIYNLDTFKKQIDVNSIDLDSELVDLNYKVASLIFCHFWRSIRSRSYYACGKLRMNDLVVNMADDRWPIGSCISAHFSNFLPYQDVLLQ